MEAPTKRCGDIVATLRPTGRRIPRFERDWPVEVTVGEAGLWSYRQEVVFCAWVCGMFAVTLVAGTSGIGKYCGIYAIASNSMLPILIRGDGRLVEKVGDNGAASVDSRFGGRVAKGDVICRPIGRIFRVDRFLFGGLDDP